MWAQLNSLEYAVSFARDDKSFNCRKLDNDYANILPDVTIHVSEPKRNQSEQTKMSAIVKYCLHPTGLDDSIIVGSQVLLLDGLCPPWHGQPNNNMFHDSFGIEYKCNDHVLVRPFSPFEFVCCFRWTDDLTYKLSHPDCVA